MIIKFVLAIETNTPIQFALEVIYLETNLRLTLHQF